MTSIRSIGFLIAATLAVLCVSAIGQTVTLYDSWNTNTVGNGPTCSPLFTINKPYMITYIDTYHWNGGMGDSSYGTISLKNENGDTFGPWTTAAESGSGVANVWWIAHPNEVIPDGSYIIIDSNPETWSRNSESPCGFAKVEGNPVSKKKTDGGEITENKGIVRAFVTVSGDCSNPIEILTEGCDKGLPDIPVELTFTYIPPDYSNDIPQTLREITNKNGMAEFKDVPAGSKFKVKTSVKTMEKELEGTMPDRAEQGLQLNFDYTCKGQLIGNTYYPCGYKGVKCSPECQLYPL